MPAGALSRLATIQPSCKTLHETLPHPEVTRLYEYSQRLKVPISLDEVKRVAENRKTQNVRSVETALCGSPAAILSGPPNLASDYQLTLSALNQWLEAKTNTFSQWWMSLVGFRSPSISETSHLMASSNVFRHFLPSSEPPCSFTPTGAHSSCHRKSKTGAKMDLRPPKLFQWPKRTQWSQSPKQ